MSVYPYFLDSGVCASKGLGCVLCRDAQDKLWSHGWPCTHQAHYELESIDVNTFVVTVIVDIL